MIVSEPFAVAYGLEALLHTLVIDIGAGTTDFCVMNGRYPTEEDQRTLTQAGDSVDEQLRQLIAARYPEANFSSHMVREWKEEHSFVGEAKEPVMVEAPVKGKPTELDITDEMRQACESLLPPVTETMLDLISRVAARVPGQGAPERHPVGRQRPDPRASARRCRRRSSEIGGGQVRVVKDPIYVGSDGGWRWPAMRRRRIGRSSPPEDSGAGRPLRVDLSDGRLGPLQAAEASLRGSAPSPQGYWWQ